MRPVQLALALLVFVIACGEAEGPVAVSLTRAANLDADLNSVCVTLHAGARDCEVVRRSAVAGSYVARLSPMGAEEVSGDLTRVRAGIYTAVAWGGDASGAATAFGCSPPISVEAGEETALDLVLEPLEDLTRAYPCGVD